MNELTGLHFSRWVTLVLCGTWNGAASLFSCVVSLFGICSSILSMTLNTVCVHRLGNWCSYTVIASLNSIQFQHIWFRCVLIVDEIYMHRLYRATVQCCAGNFLCAAYSRNEC